MVLDLSNLDSVTIPVSPSANVAVLPFRHLAQLLFQKVLPI
jgi:hypothetical protein